MSVAYFDTLLAVRGNLELTVSERLLLGVYIFRANEDGTCRYGYAGIGKQIGKDKANVKKLCDSLRAKGLIRRQGSKGVVVDFDELMKYLTKSDANAPAKGGADDSPKAEKPTTPPPEISSTPQGSNMHPPEGGSRNPPYKHKDYNKRSDKGVPPYPPRGGEGERVVLNDSDTAFFYDALRPHFRDAPIYAQVRLLKSARTCAHCGYTTEQILSELSPLLRASPQSRTPTEKANEALNIMSRMIGHYIKNHPTPPQILYDFEPFLAKYPEDARDLENVLVEWYRWINARKTPAQILKALNEAIHTSDGLRLYGNNIIPPETWLREKAQRWLL